MQACITSLSTFPNIRRSIPSFPISTSAETNAEKITENSRSWLADSPAASIAFLPIYWLITTAPPDASAVNR